MFNLKSFFHPGRSRLDVLPAVEATKPSLSPGYFRPMTASELLATTRRQQWLQSLWDYSSLPKDMYRQYYLAPLEHCVTLMQQFPLTESGPYARPGGMADYMLETVSYAARLSKSYMLPVGAPPEEQAAQSAAWNAVVVYAAMLPSLEYLCHLHVELENGKRWRPLLDAPPEPYRFRFEPEPSPERLQSFGAMLAWKIIPPEAINWLSSWPEAIKTLSTYLTGFRAQSGVVNAIVSEAIRLTAGAPESKTLVAPAAMVPVPPESLQGDTLLSGLADDVPELVASYSEEEILPAVEPAPVSDADLIFPDEQDDTDALLVMMGFASTDAAETGEITPSAESNDPGEAFWQWLVTGCRSGRLVPNKPDGRIHLVAGYVFLRAPGIFHQYLMETNAPGEDKARLQKAFERLGHHRQDNGTMYTCQLYQNEQREGRFQKLSGYMVLASKIFPGDNNPGDNPLLVVI
ncbi:relaxase [Salmonella enterica subsp. enterica serovar Legon]|uniref:TraI domain-containing protein n=1 Tax=Salmonella enterica TaxID=28901 RepID=UPI000D3E81D0|nr:TraI domain-containing protein [Salmonella enterica]PVB78928.1 relaxase [Salmonella enterica subsp. enterica serovar Legon]PVB93433.1 relaxase [Salmonella enterica subsp. enterica serovar Legon]PVB94659.1 relaxase [Salmonella enterica subsp. enterica serovar Legon]PVC02194.1 relaxase [Salmonella enterica subsp. enterica serovar Legon]PVC06879.1 relaxase [Salmonella enterica subsp. enterica serovar Legon]